MRTKRPVNGPWKESTRTASSNALYVSSGYPGCLNNGRCLNSVSSGTALKVSSANCPCDEN